MLHDLCADKIIQNTRKEEKCVTLGFLLMLYFLEAFCTYLIIKAISFLQLFFLCPPKKNYKIFFLLVLIPSGHGNLGKFYYFHFLSCFK